MPELAAVMLGKVRELPVWPESGTPSLAHCKPNGPVPCAAVLKLTVSPGQLVWVTSASAVGGIGSAGGGEIGEVLAGAVSLKQKGPGRGACPVGKGKRNAALAGDRGASLGPRET